MDDFHRYSMYLGSVSLKTFVAFYRELRNVCITGLLPNLSAFKYFAYIIFNQHF